MTSSKAAEAARRHRLSYIQRLRIKLRARYGNRCNHWDPATGKRCDVTAPNMLQFAHVAPTGVCSRGRGRFERLLDIQKNADCYTYLCRPHHQEFDDQYWARRREMEELRRRKAEAAGVLAEGEEAPF
jgi:hypothetical protein